MRQTVDRFVMPFFTRRFLQFAVVGASGVVVNLTVLALCKSLGVHINAASALAIEVSLLSNFFINHAWTFRDRRDAAGHVAVQALRFHVVCFFGAALQFAIFVAMNMVWLHTVLDAGAAMLYDHGATGLERWLWHPLWQPPDVGNWVYVSQLMGIVGGTASNYLMNFHWTWAETETGDNAGTIPTAPAGSGSGSGS